MVTDKMIQAAAQSIKATADRGLTLDLRAAIEAALAAAWVPCAERMPEQGTEVLVYVTGEPDWDWDPFVTIARWNGDAAWWSDERVAEFPARDVSRWMPLPAPPSTP